MVKKHSRLSHDAHIVNKLLEMLTEDPDGYDTRKALFIFSTSSRFKTLVPTRVEQKIAQGLATLLTKKLGRATALLQIRCLQHPWDFNARIDLTKKLLAARRFQAAKAEAHNLIQLLGDAGIQVKRALCGLESKDIDWAKDLDARFKAVLQALSSLQK